MDKEAPACIDCPVREACPPQQRANLIGSSPTRDQLSTLRQTLYRFHCPPSEWTRLVDPLQKGDPARAANFNPRVISSHSTPDAEYVRDRLRENGKSVR